MLTSLSTSGLVVKVPFYVSQSLLFLFSVGFLVLGFTLPFVPKYKGATHLYRNLHPMEYPTSVTDLAVVSFRTPALPARLASAWEIQNMLDMPKDPTASVYAMVYPVIDKTIGMQHLLQMHKAPSQADCAACSVQSAFTVSNAILANQTQFYCPHHGELEVDWLRRTEQEQTVDISNAFKQYTHFEFYNEHASDCRAQRMPPMVLAHVATNVYSLFSSHNVAILLLYTACVNALFSAVIFLYRWYGHKVGDQNNDERMRLYLHGQFILLTFVVCLLPILSTIPLMIDYFQRKDQESEKQSTLYGSRAFGSYILGLWTLLFSLLYIYVLPAFQVIFKKEDEEKGTSAARDTDKKVLECLAEHKPIISFAYWNFLQTPCLVMVLLAANTYGIDGYMQFIIFGTIAIGALDIVHARLTTILSVTHKIKEKPETKALLVVFCVFGLVKLLIAVAVLVKLVQLHLMDGAVFAVVILFMTQTCQNLLVLLMRGCGGSAYSFDASLIWHLLITGVAFGVAYQISITDS